MALPDWQLALGQMVAARAAGRELAVPELLAGLELDDTERAWLAGVSATRGFGLTGFIPRWWRETRVRRAARLTLAALGDAAAAHLRDYLRSVPAFTLFFVPEGIAFLDYIETLDVPDLVRSVARFERAMWHARLDAATVPAAIRFAAPPEAVLAAALRGEPLPAPTAGPHFAVVSPAAPGAPGLWRVASGDEALALAADDAALADQRTRSTSITR